MPFLRSTYQNLCNDARLSERLEDEGEDAGEEDDQNELDDEEREAIVDWPLACPRTRLTLPSCTEQVLLVVLFTTASSSLWYSILEGGPKR